MRTTRVRTPIWIKLAIVAVCIAGPAWWIVQRQDRVGNESRLRAIASAIAGRPVQVRCPGVYGRIFSWDIVEGSVRFDASGRPGDETRLRELTCAELDALAEGRRAGALACLEAGGACGPETDDVALAVSVLAHEAWHLAGVIDEAVTECRSVQSIAWTAQRLGTTPAQGRALAKRYLQTWYPRLPDRYRTGDCANGSELDLRPDDPGWP
jgi:hypothetical protein